MNKLIFPVVGALVALTTAMPAANAAATFGDWLAYCAGGDATVDATIQQATLAECEVTEGSMAACSVVSGMPWACATPSTEYRSENVKCSEHKLTFEIGAGLAMPGGWKVEGKATATYTRSGTKGDISSCNATPMSPPPSGQGGRYIKESGTMTYSVSFTVDGNIKVTSPTGISVNLNASAACNRRTTGNYIDEHSVSACSPSPSPTPSPTASPTPSPTSTPSPTPTP